MHNPKRRFAIEKTLELFAVAIATALIGACGGGGGDGNSALIRVLHASPDAPAVRVLVDGNELLSEIDYKAGSRFTDISAGLRSIEVQAYLPAGTSTLFGPMDVTLTENVQYSLVVADELAAIQPLLITSSNHTVRAGFARVQVVHAAPNTQRVSAFVTVPGADLNAAMPIGTISFLEDTAQREVTEGAQQIRVTDASDRSNVLFDSGEVTLFDGDDVLIVAVDSNGAARQPITLILWYGGIAIEVPDIDDPANFRVVHTSPDAPALDVVVDDDFMNPTVSGLTYTNADPPPNDYFSFAAGSYNIKITDTATQGTLPVDATLPLDAAQQYSVLAADFFSGMDLLRLADNNRRVPTEARLRVIHAAPRISFAVDVYVTPVGADIDDEDPDLTGVPYQNQSAYLRLAGGTYDLTLTQAATTQIRVGPVPITVSEGGVYTAIARDATGGSGGTPLGFILLDDFVP